jgi:N-methylhydantoinase A
MLGIRRILMPNLAGVFTAAGMLAGDVEREFLNPLAGLLDDQAVGRIGSALDALAGEARDALEGEGFAAGEIEIERRIDLRFESQDTELGIELGGDPERETAAVLRERFMEAYERIYEYRARDRIELVAARVVGRGRRGGKLDFQSHQARAPGASGAGGHRMVMFSREGGLVPTPVVDRRALGGLTHGPLIVESLDTTAVVPPDAALTTDEAGNLRIELES